MLTYDVDVSVDDDAAMCVGGFTLVDGCVSVLHISQDQNPPPHSPPGLWVHSWGETGLGLGGS